MLCLDVALANLVSCLVVCVLCILILWTGLVWQHKECLGDWF